MSTVTFNAIILAGGRSSRLGGTPKALLSDGSMSLLESTFNAVLAALNIVVVGPADLPVDDRVILTRENPPFAGPAAALAAGASQLASLSSIAPWTIILSVDMPYISQAIGTLVEAAANADAETLGFMGVTDGITQPLVGIYRTEHFVQALNTDMTDCSVRFALRPLSPATVVLPAGSTDDVDTWDAAHATGFDLTR